MLLGLYMVAGIPRFQWRTMREFASSTRLNFLKKHIKEYNTHNLQDQHRCPCKQYCKASSMEEDETRYHAIKVWWALSSATSNNGLKHLDLWLAF